MGAQQNQVDLGKKLYYPIARIDELPPCFFFQVYLRSLTDQVMYQQKQKHLFLNVCGGCKEICDYLHFLDIA